jgi:hypothetical protein
MPIVILPPLSSWVHFYSRFVKMMLRFTPTPRASGNGVKKYWEKTYLPLLPYLISFAASLTCGTHLLGSLPPPSWQLLLPPTHSRGRSGLPPARASTCPSRRAVRPRCRHRRARTGRACPHSRSSWSRAGCWGIQENPSPSKRWA